MCDQGSIVVGLAYDCKENRVYWTDLSARTINRASMAPGAEPEILVNTSNDTLTSVSVIKLLLVFQMSSTCVFGFLHVDLVSPEGLAVDVNRRLLFWVDSNADVIESSNLDGSGRRTLFDTDLVNPRAIIAISSSGYRPLSICQLCF